MTVTGVVGGAAAVLAATFVWAFRCLPCERWQILASVPRRRTGPGEWTGVNLTYYGAISAAGAAAAVFVATFLLGAAGMGRVPTVAGIAAVMAVCVPAAKLMNRAVEHHWHGFTVGGAAFVGILTAPWVAAGLERGWSDFQAMPFLAAVACAYALGEGIGRLACISFGCCYGRRLADCPTWMRRVFDPIAFVFKGPLKKAAYASGWEGERLLPIQAVTAVISCGAALAGAALFLHGAYAVAYGVAVAVTQLWRFLSEFLRADWRGGRRISFYQWMALAGVLYTQLVAVVWPVTMQAPPPSLAAGARATWTPGTILMIQAVWLLVFLYMGISTVTDAELRFRVVRPPER